LADGLFNEDDSKGLNDLEGLKKVLVLKNIIIL
jgi:hypothetical protein